MANYMDDFRARVAQRRAARDEAAVADYQAAADRARIGREVRSQRSRFIDSIPGLSMEQRADLRFKSSARANAASILQPEQAARLREFEDTLASGASNVADYRNKRMAEQQKQYVVEATPEMLGAEIAQGQAKARADEALAAVRTAQAKESEALTPAEVEALKADTLLKQLGAKGVESGELVPPSFDQVKKPEPISELDIARANKTRVETAQLIDTLKRGRGSEADKKMIQVYERILSDSSDGTAAEKKEAREQLAAIAARLRKEGNIGEDSIRQAIDETGRRVYEITPGSWVYEDGSRYVFNQEEMLNIAENELGQN